MYSKFHACQTCSTRTAVVLHVRLAMCTAHILEFRSHNQNSSRPAYRTCHLHCTRPGVQISSGKTAVVLHAGLTTYTAYVLEFRFTQPELQSSCMQDLPCTLHMSWSSDLHNKNGSSPACRTCHVHCIHTLHTYIHYCIRYVMLCYVESDWRSTCLHIFDAKNFCCNSAGQRHVHYGFNDPRLHPTLIGGIHFWNFHACILLIN